MTYGILKSFMHYDVLSLFGEKWNAFVFYTFGNLLFQWDTIAIEDHDDS